MKKMIYFLLVLLIAVALLCFALQAKSGRQIGFSLEILVNERTEEVTCWKQDDANYYFFLPSYAELSEARVRFLSNQKVYIDGLLLTDGMSCDAFQLNVPYQGSYTVWGRTYNTQITFVKSANVAAMHIDTASGSMNYIHHEKENQEAGVIRLYTADGKLDYAGEIEAIEGRGNSTWVDHEKKPYNVKLSQAANVLNMGVAQRWVLFANAYDPTNMCNRLVSDFAQDAGLRYSPDSCWVDLYLNGVYAGLYLLSERNEVLTERVQISEQGSYLVSLEREDRILENNYSYVSTQAGMALRIHYPYEVNPTMLEGLKNKFQSIENAFLSADGIDNVTGKKWTEMIDVDSWVRKYLIEEIFANTDGCALSQFFYQNGADSTGKFYAGPVWDYDASLGNSVPWQIPSTNAFYANRPLVKDGEELPWFYALYRKQEFFNQVIQVYEMEFLPLIQELLTKRINDYATLISQAAQMNNIRWNIEQEFWTSVKNMSSFLIERRDFLSKLWLDKIQYYIVCVYPGKNMHHLYCVVEHGQSMMPLPQLEKNEYQRFLGWYYVDTDTPFDSAAPIFEDTEIYAKWEDSDSKKIDQAVKLIPLVIIAMLGVCVLSVEICRSRKYR